MYKSKSGAAGKPSVFITKIYWLFLDHPYLLLLIPLFFIAYPLMQPGISIGGDFPSLDTSNYAFDRLWMWAEKGSFPSFESIPRFPIVGLLYLLGFINAGSDTITKLMIVMGFFIASFSFYFCFLFLLKDKLISIIRKNNSNTLLLLKFSAISGSLFYAYNVWSFHRIAHWYLWIGYALLPLFIICIVFSYKNSKRWKYLLLSVLLWTLASSTPHMVVFYAIIFAGTFFGLILNDYYHNNNNNNKKYNIKKRKTAIIKEASIPFLLILVFYFLVNLYWIYPYVMVFQTRTISPNYIVSEENIETLSRQSNFLNTFRLIANWLEPETDRPAQDSLLYSLWTFVSFIPPFFAFLALIIAPKRSSTPAIKYSLVFSSLALIGITLAMGTKSPFDYYSLLLANPLLSKYVWIFRDPDKWSFLIALSYSFLIGISSYCLFLGIRRRSGDRKKQESRKDDEEEEEQEEKASAVAVTKGQNKFKKINLMVSSFFLFILIASIGLSSYPVYKYNIQERYKPKVIPAEFDRLNSYLSNVGDEKVFFMPYPLTKTNWNNLTDVGRIYQVLSAKPSIEAIRGPIGNYYDYFVSSIVKKYSKNVGNFIYPFGTSNIIFHDDRLDEKKNDYPNLGDRRLLNTLYSLKDIKTAADIGFYKIFQANNNNNNTDDNKSNSSSRQINLIKQNIASLGGLQDFNSLNTIRSFNSLNSSIFFLDQMVLNNPATFMKSFDDLILKRSSADDLILSFLDDKYIVEPFSATVQYDPSKTWSRSSAVNSYHGLHPYIEDFGIENWEFDYGKGLVMTQSLGAKLSVPFNIEQEGGGGLYSIFLRYMANQKGGLLRIYIDNNTLIDEINTKEYRSNKFVWKEVGSSSSSPIKLSKGKHILTLENVEGLNVVNIFAFIPSLEMNRLKQLEYLLVNNTRSIIPLEAESNFYNSRGRSVSDAPDYHLFNNYHTTMKKNNNNSNNTFDKTSSGQFRVPAATDLMSLQLVAQVNSNTNSSYSINNLVISPANTKNDVFVSDFERTKQVTIPLATLRHLDWVNYDKDVLFTSLDNKNNNTNNSNYGNGTSLRVDIKTHDNDFKVISTDFIPVKEDAYYNLSLAISAKDTKQLHARIAYFDSKKKTIENEIIFPGIDGSFNKNTYTSSILPPARTQYMKIQILVTTDPGKIGTYWIDDVKLQEVIPYREFKISSVNFKNQDFWDKTLVKMSPPAAAATAPADPTILGSHLEKGNKTTTNTINNSTEYKIIQQTKPFHVKPNQLYNYTIAVEPKNVTSLEALVSFKSSNDVIENSTKYGANASNGTVLSLSPGSEVYSDLDILKPSNYTIALRAKTCGICNNSSNSSFLRVSVVGQEERQNDDNADHNNNNTIKTTNISLKDDDTNNASQQQLLKWLYINNTYLKQGRYEIKIHSDSQTDLDSVIIYSTNDHSANNDLFTNNNNKVHHINNETVEDLFSSKGIISQPGHITGYKKINPTKYIVEIHNATRPYMLSFAESYDPLWIAYTTSGNVKDSSTNNNNNNHISFETNSIPLYSIVNGFYINKTGDYTLTLEYKPQQWFTIGATISLITLIVLSILCIFILDKHAIYKKVKSNHFFMKHLEKYFHSMFEHK